MQRSEERFRVEEEVRQRLIKHMVERLGYPASLLVVEKKISQLPHLALFPDKLPNRRVDILAYAMDENQKLSPLLLIECKAERFSLKEQSQLLGYNYFVRAPFIALVANQNTTLFTCKESKPLQDALLPYKTLLQMTTYQ